MSFFANMKHKKFIIWIVSIITVISLCFGAFAIYVNDYYRADPKAISAFVTVDNIAIEKRDDTTVYAPENATNGFIFYPGGKVEHTAYEPLMKACADKGILCVLVEMPFNLAVFDVNAANGIVEMYPEIKNWYIGGHSLGGSMAAAYIADNTDDFKGLILLGSYSATDLSETELKVLSIYGSEDLVLNRDKYNENKINLPKGFTEIVIDGGCHAGFGVYGAQDGDGTPTITSREQITITADKISAHIK
jgi:hypothetical protein